MIFFILSLCVGDTVFICFKDVERKIMLVRFEIMVSCKQIFVVNDINIAVLLPVYALSPIILWSIN